MIPSPDVSGRQPRRDRPDERADLPPELRVVVLDDCLADACRTAQDILDLAAAVRINMIDMRGGDLLQRLLTRARRAGKVRALLKAAHERFPDHDDLTWLHDSMFGRPPARQASADSTTTGSTTESTPAGSATAAWGVEPSSDRAGHPTSASPAGSAPAGEIASPDRTATSAVPSQSRAGTAPPGQISAPQRRDVAPSSAIPSPNRAGDPASPARQRAGGEASPDSQRPAADASPTERQATADTPPDRHRPAAEESPEGRRARGEAWAGGNAGVWTHETVEVAEGGHESQQMMASPQAAARVK
ncbi:hypothetical protein J2S43_003137 [Catenuloplanes nepalensis]|uniref:Uncharacterized protein n=1 Tax=Catenuloplanes nepalensis TaxID=587533 RepID=A0ABT9MT88_9ACTN|nr:hypothetical protein [Catenuloplanes nepalensis]MDP9794625.1 hypothetical protein [Catenuloplanes nepalensis]